MYIGKKSKGGNPTQGGGFQYHYNYQNTGFSTGNISSETGKLLWSQDIKDDEPKTKNDNG